MAATGTYARFATDLRVGDVPGEVRRAAALHLLDALGCGLAAVGLEATPFAGATAEEDGPGAATVLGLAAGAPPPSAALANGILVHALDFDDTHAGSIAHVSAVVGPAALAAAEEVGASGAELLAALLVGNEITVRVGLPAGDAFHHRGFHPTAICGVFGATAAVGRLRGLDAERIVQALGIAGSMAAGLLAYLSDGASTKRVHAGWMAHAAHAAVRLAAHGATGPARVLEDRAGVYHAFLGRDDVDPAAAAATLGEHWETPAIAFKPYPACHFLHPALDALAAVLDEHALAVDDVTGVTVLAPRAAVDMVCDPVARKRRPTTTYDAKFSAPWSAGALLADGRVDVSTYVEERLADPAILAVADRVDHEERDYATFPASFAAGVRVRTRAGATHEHHLNHQRGGPEWPMPAADVRAKFATNAATALGVAEAARLEEAVLAIEDLPDLAPLRALGTAAPQI
ncbi:MAG TPA: MmgE/PrpD family protein [Solirubrobacteraceae bacterium]